MMKTLKQTHAYRETGTSRIIRQLVALSLFLMCALPPARAENVKSEGFSAMEQQRKTITGNVVDETGQPVV